MAITKKGWVLRKKRYGKSGSKNPEKTRSTKLGDKNPMFGKTPWNKNLRGYMKPNKTSFKRGKKNINYGRTTPTNYGETHWNWKGGITPYIMKLRNSAKYRIWRDVIFLRNDFTCQECGVRGIFLHAHHIKFFSEYPELRFRIDNGITLCNKCHCKLHQRLKKESTLLNRD